MKFKYPILTYYFDKKHGFYWFRIFGYGLHWKDINKNMLWFSDRKYIGTIKRPKIGKYLFKFLKPNNIG